MRFQLLPFFICVYSVTFGQIHQTKEPSQKYVLISLVKEYIPEVKKKMSQAEINQKDIDKLSEPLRALAAYYSALWGSNCNRGDSCNLTTALGLGKQNSIGHKAILKKWFSKDTIAKEMIDQNCFVGISGSSSFCNYNFLRFEQRHDTLIVNYQSDCYDHGSNFIFNGHDKAIIRDDQIIFLQRQKKKR